VVYGNTPLNPRPEKLLISPRTSVCSPVFVEGLTNGWPTDIIGYVLPLVSSFCILLQWIRLGTIFYLGYLAFEFPQNWALQRLPVGRWMRLAAHAWRAAASSEATHSSLNILIWGVALCSHAACKNFAGLFACRLILGICEGSITAGFLIVSSMFYTRREQTVRVGYWCEDFNQPPCVPLLTL
jgi:MFS family permease